jgi:outer membrane protein OmpA-like peptidoglycan-associated protein
MNFRLALAASTTLFLPLLAHAQPVTGPYVDLGLGTSLLSSEHYTYPDGFGGKEVSRPDYAGVGGVGYGFGNGFRIQVDGNFDRNSDHKYVNGGGSGREYGGDNRYGAMVNALYDIPIAGPIVPYVGVGVGYQWEKLEHVNYGGGTLDGTGGSIAFDGIAGVAYNLSFVPGLAVTAEYRIMDATSKRTFLDTGDQENFKYRAQTSHTILLGLRYQLFPPPQPVAAATSDTEAAAAPVAAPAAAPAKTYLVFFDWDKSDLTTKATQIISQAASDSKTNNVTTLDVSGYTDTSGTADYNQGLSERRAKSVAGELEADGVPATEIQINAYGETHLLVPTGPGVREPQNRRVEIVLN